MLVCASEGCDFGFWNGYWNNDDRKNEYYECEDFDDNEFSCDSNHYIESFYDGFDDCVEDDSFYDDENDDHKCDECLFWSWFAFVWAVW